AATHRAHDPVPYGDVIDSMIGGDDFAGAFEPEDGARLASRAMRMAGPHAEIGTVEAARPDPHQDLVGAGDRHVDLANLEAVLAHKRCLHDRSGRPHHYPAATRLAWPGAGAFGAEDEAADFEQLPAVFRPVGPEALRGARQGDRDRFIADDASHRDAGHTGHALAIDPGVAVAAGLGNAGAQAVLVDRGGFGKAAQLVTLEQAHRFFLGQDRKQGVAEGREVHGDPGTDALDVSQRIAAL